MQRRWLMPPQQPQRLWVDIDRTLIRHSLATGICLLAVGLFSLFSAYTVWYRLNAPL
jgi:hypothetical protein